MNGQSADIPQAGPSNSSADGEQDSQPQAQGALPDGQHSAVICEHLWKTGWQQGLYSDVEVRVRNRPYKLHRIILSKSPYMVYLINMTPYGHPIWIPVPDDAMYEEAVAIVLGYLYASHMYAEVNTANARSVLAVATVFGIPDLAAYAYEVCRQSININNILDWVSWIDQQTPPTSDQNAAPPSPAPTPFNAPMEGSHVLSAGLPQSNTASETMNFGTTPGVSYSPAPSQTGSSSSVAQKEESAGQGRPPNGWQDVLSQPATSFVTQLKQDIYTFLVSQLPTELAQSERHTKLAEDPKFINVFVQLPFDLFKACIEDSRLDLGSDMERFAFAKTAIQQRKKKATLKSAQGPFEGPSVVENVVLRIGGGSGSKVHITRKSKSRSLWKVNKE